MKFIKRIRAKVAFYKTLLHELIETLCTICLFLEQFGRLSRPEIHAAQFALSGHFRELKKFSEALREEINEERKTEERRKDGSC